MYTTPNNLVLLLSVCFCITLPTRAQDESIAEPAAVSLLDKMSGVIGDLESCSFKVESSQYTFEFEFGQLTRHANHVVYFKGPDKMQVYSQKHDGQRAMWYNGEEIAYYSFRQNNYSILPFSGSLIAMFDSLHFNYNIDFPAADIFYPAFTDDVLESFSKLHLVGITEVDGLSCYHILAQKPGMVMELWLANDAFHLPVRLSITEQTDEKHSRYTLHFKDWQLNPLLPNSMFNFNIPPQARKITMVPKN